MASLNRTRPSIYSVDDLVAEADYQGSHFFDDDTMKSFGTKLTNGFFPVSYGDEEGKPSIGWFVTTEYTADRWFTGSGGGRQCVLRRYTVGHREDGRVDIDIQTVVAHIPSSKLARMKHVAEVAAGVERAQGLDDAYDFVAGIYGEDAVSRLDRRYRIEMP